MSSVGAFLSEMVILYCIALIGFIGRKKGILNGYTNDVLTQLILYITLPALILFSLHIPLSTTIAYEFFTLITLSIYILMVACFLAYFLRKRAQLPNEQKSVYEGLIIFGNQGFIGYAVCFILFKETGLIYLTIFNLCYFILIWTYGIYLFTQNKQTIEWKKILLNPGVFSTFLGIVLLFLPVSWPSILEKTFETIGKMTIPLSMIMIGCLIAEVTFKEFSKIIRNLYLWKIVIAKLLLIPLLFLPFVPFIPFPLLVVATIVSGMPSAPTISLYSQKFGGDAVFASFGVMVTTLLCLVTIPLLYIILVFLYRYV